MNSESTEVVIARLAMQIEGLTKEIVALRNELTQQRVAHSELGKKIEFNRADADVTRRDLVDLKAMLRGGSTVLIFFQAVVFGAFFWLFSQVSAHGTAITEIKGLQQHFSSLIERNGQQLSQIIGQINRSQIPQRKE